MPQTIFIQATTVGPNTGPFDIYSIDSGEIVTGPFETNISKATLIAGLLSSNAPNDISKVKLVSTSVECPIILILPLPITTTTTAPPTTTTSSTTTSTSTTTTSTSTTTTCAPQYMLMALNGVTSITNVEITSSLPFSIFWNINDLTSKVDYAAGTYTNISKTYSSSFTGFAKIQSCDLTSITKLIIEEADITATPPSGSYPIVIQGSEFSKLDGLIYGIFSKFVYLQNINTIMLSRVMQTFVSITNNMSGTTNTIPTTMLIFILYGNNTISGNINMLPPGLTNIEVTGINTISGIVGTMPTSITGIIIFGENTIGGPLSGVTNPNLIYFRFLGYTTIYGDLSDFNSHWDTLQSFGIGGRSNQVYIAPPGNLTSVITGNLNSLPKIPVGPLGDGTKPFRNDMFLFQLVQGFNTVSGNINNFPDSIVNLEITGTSTNALSFTGTTVTGNLSDLPHTNVSTLTLGGQNTITGDLSTYGVAPKVDIFEIYGFNTISGDLKFAPATVRQFSLHGNNTVNAYTAGRSTQSGAPGPWAGGNYMFFETVPYSMMVFELFSTVGTGITSQADLNRLITDLNLNSIWNRLGTIKKSVRIKSALAPTSTAVAALSNLNTVSCPPPDGEGALVIP